MRLKVWLALGTVVALTLGITAGTYALFSATTTNSDSIFTAGTVALTSWRDQGDTVPGPMFYTTPAEGQTPSGLPGLLPTGHWAPGDKHMRVLMVRNTGTLAAWLKSIQTDMTPGSSIYLAQKLQVKVTTDSAGLNVLASGTMADFINTDQTFSTPISINPGPAPKVLYFHVELPLDADNSYQGLTLRVDFSVYAEQKANNP